MLNTRLLKLQKRTQRNHINGLVELYLNKTTRKPITNQHLPNYKGYESSSIQETLNFGRQTRFMRQVYSC